MRARPDLRPNWYLLVTVAAWGFNFVAIKEAYKEIPPPQMALIRYLVMWGCLVLICLWRKESLRYPKEDTWKILYLGFISLGVYMLAFLEGMRGSAATEGAILFQLSPVFTALIAAGMRIERFSIGSLIGAIVALSGTALIVYHPDPGQANKPVYNLVVIGAALLWAYSVTLMRPLLAKYSPLQLLTLSMPGAAPVMIAYGLMPTLHHDWSHVSPYAWGMTFHIVFLSGVVAFIFFYKGVQQVGASGATLYQFLVPVSAVIFSFAVQGLKPSWYQLAGFLIVLAGVGYALRARYLAQT